MSLNLKARKCLILLSYFVIIQGIFTTTNAQEIAGFAHSNKYATNLLRDTHWSESSSWPNVKAEFPETKQIPLTTCRHSQKKINREFDPILQLFKMKQKSATRVESSSLTCSLEETATTSAIPRQMSPFSRIDIQTAITCDQFPKIDSFLIDSAEDVTLMIGGTFNQNQFPEWLNSWNKLVFNFHQPGRGNCQFYFHNLGNGIIILGNNSVQTKQKIYLVLLESSTEQSASENPGFDSNSLAILQSAICVEYRQKNPGPCTIEIVDIQESPVRKLYYNNKLRAGKKIAQFWDGCNDAGLAVANGIYFYKISATTDFTNCQKNLKLIVLR